MCTVKKALLVVLAAMPLSAQWKTLPKDDAPLTKDGKVDLTAPAPRRDDGKPDLTGPWRPVSGKWVNNIAVDLKPDEFPIQPWAAELTKVHAVNQGDEPDANCRPGGVPKVDGTPYPFKIISAGPKLMVILYETFGMYRQLYLDGREFDRGGDYNPAWLGFSVAKWDGDTLVIDTRGGNGRTWLDKIGHPTSEDLHVTERFHRVDFGHMDLGITVDDSKVFTKPWSMTEHFVYFRHEFQDDTCENEQDTKHMPHSGSK